MKKILIETAGWIGMALILTAYCLISFNVLTSHSVWYQVLNSIGSVGIIVVAVHKKNWQPMVLNIIWILIAIIAILRMI